MKPGNINIGFGTQEILAEVKSKQFSFKMPFVGNKVTVGFSAVISAGGSGHLTLSKKDGMSAGFNVGIGPGMGIDLKVK